MSLPSHQERIYSVDKAAAFLRAKEQWGGFSNMNSAFKIIVNGHLFHSSEHLYQAIRFSNDSERQQLIMNERSPMAAKRVAYGLWAPKGMPMTRLEDNPGREDWQTIKIPVMKWAVRAKIAHNFDDMADLFEQSLRLPIVEISKRDRFWGAAPDGQGNLVGINALGRIIMGERERYFEYGRSAFEVVNPLSIDDFSLLGQAVKPIFMTDKPLSSQGAPKVESKQTELQL